VSRPGYVGASPPPLQADVGQDVPHDGSLGLLAAAADEHQYEHDDDKLYDDHDGRWWSAIRPHGDLAPVVDEQYLRRSSDRSVGLFGQRGLLVPTHRGRL
jgi:hypothetical protein